MTRTPTLAQLLKHAIENRLLDLQTALIARVESYDAAKQEVNVSPVLKRALPTLDGEDVEEQLPVICDVPVLFPRAGGFFISFPIKAGDLVQVIFNEKSGLGGAVAIPAVPMGAQLKDAHEKNLVVGQDGGVQIHFDGDKIRLGSEKADEALAIASKVETELNKIITAFNLHTHLSSMGLIKPTDKMSVPSSTAAKNVVAE